MLYMPDNIYFPEEVAWRLRISNLGKLISNIAINIWTFITIGQCLEMSCIPIRTASECPLAYICIYDFQLCHFIWKPANINANASFLPDNRIPGENE